MMHEEWCALRQLTASLCKMIHIFEKNALGKAEEK